MSEKSVFVVCLVGAAFFAMSGCTAKCRDRETKVAEAVKPSEAKSQTFAFRVNCAGSAAYTDKAGNVWLADQEIAPDKKWGSVGGMTVDRGDLGMADTNSPAVYQTERYSMEAYRFSVPNGSYTVKLHFAETYSGITGNGMRVFSVTINGKNVLTDFDPFKEAGGANKPVVKTMKDVTVADGELVIGFTPNIQNPEINGIEVLSANAH